jgi:AmmeMemoRadiSam system protein B
MGQIRPSVVAGRFYPAGQDELARLVDGVLAGARTPPSPGRLRALVAPHAGYAFSAAVAARAYATITGPAVRLRVALLGPSHYTPLAGAAVSGAVAWRTPLGEVPVDDELREAAVAAGAAVDDLPHREDHALEVQLPFLQRIAPAGLRICPVAVGGHGTEETARLVSALAGDALIVVSTDLSHYLEDAEARVRDRRTATSVAVLDPEGIGDRDACGAAALRGLVACAAGAGWLCTVLDLRTSADAGAGTGRVVGYGAFAFTDLPRGR